MFPILSFTTYPLRGLPNMILMMTQPQVPLHKFSWPVNRKAAQSPKKKSLKEIYSSSYD